ncbi:MAG: hypothetical protein IH624_14350 [Phycisphaerae bacterium]|nr:hypothetical protein [Phycisphaerae bacterium]
MKFTTNIRHIVETMYSAVTIAGSTYLTNIKPKYECIGSEFITDVSSLACNYICDALANGGIPVEAAIVKTSVSAAVSKVQNRMEDYLERVGKITLDAKKACLTITAYNQSASIVSLMTCQDLDKTVYTCKEEGYATVSAEAIMASLKSFPPENIIEISSDAEELSMWSDGNCGGLQTIPVYDNCIVIPSTHQRLGADVAINRTALIDGLKPLARSRQAMDACQGVAITVSRHHIQFVTSMNGVATLTRVNADGIADAKQPVVFQIPAQYIRTIVRVLSASLCGDVKIGRTSKECTDILFMQVGDHKMYWTTSDVYSETPSFENMLDYQFAHEISSCVTDWARAVTYIASLDRREESKSFIRVITDHVKGCFFLEPFPSNETKPCKIPFCYTSRFKYLPNLQEDTCDAYFVSETSHLMHMIRGSKKACNLTMFFDTSDSNSKTGCRKVLVRYPATKKRATNATETCVLLFPIHVE